MVSIDYLWIVSLVGCAIIFVLNFDLTRWALKRRLKLKKPIFVTALLCMIFSGLFLINQIVILTICIYISNNNKNQINQTQNKNLWMYWTFNSIFYRIAKFMMFLFFFARYVFDSVCAMIC